MSRQISHKEMTKLNKIKLLIFKYTDCEVCNTSTNQTLEA